MWYPAAVTTAPTSEIISIDEVRAHLRVDHSDEDPLIQRLIATAEKRAETHCSIRLRPQTLTLKCDSFSDFERLPEAPVSSITSINYIDSQQAPQTLANSVWELRADGLENSIVLKYGQSWPGIGSRSRITVVLAAGFAQVPAEIIHGMHMLIGHWYENREATAVDLSAAEMPIGPYHLFENYRRFA